MQHATTPGTRSPGRNTQPRKTLSVATAIHPTYAHRLSNTYHLSSTIKGEKGKASKGEGPRVNWEKLQVLWICRGVGVVTSRVIRDEYRI